MKAWRCVAHDEKQVLGLAVETGLPLPLLRILTGRGLCTAGDIDRFLKPRLSDLSDPFDIPGMAAAVDRVWTAVREGERIAVFGDFDVDGVTSAALLVKILDRLGAAVTAHLPNRIEEGYGLSVQALEPCIRRIRPTLLVTVDCGSSAREAVAFAHRQGIDVVVTDHHEVEEGALPDTTVVNPKLGQDERTRMLAGVGVAFKLCHGLVKRARDENHPSAELDLREYLELVAIGTIADIVPLRHENRILAHHGLGRLNSTGSAGLQALLKVSKVRTPVRSHHVGFMLGPRMNAAGRMGDAQQALELLLTEASDRADKLAAALDKANADRKRTEKAMVDEAIRDIEAHYDPARDFGLVVGRPGWHVGVIGIVASRLCGRYGRPVVVISFDAETGQGRGSARSVEGFDLLGALKECGDVLNTFGGHEMAAGISLDQGRLDAFRECFNRQCAAGLSHCDLTPRLQVDAWVTLSDLDDRLYDAIEQLMPFGHGNREPVWGVRGVSLAGPPVILSGDHLKFGVMSGRRVLEAIGFGMGDREVPPGTLDLAFTLSRREYLGQVSLQLVLEDFRPTQSL